LALPCNAQYETAAVLGKVVDPSGSSVAQATVELKSVESGVIARTISEDNGDFYFLSVKIGDYRLSASAPGFKMSKPMSSQWP